MVKRKLTRTEGKILLRELAKQGYGTQSSISGGLVKQGYKADPESLRAFLNLILHGTRPCPGELREALIKLSSNSKEVRGVFYDQNEVDVGDYIKIW